MFTFSLLYVYLYLFIFISLLGLIFTQIPLYLFVNYSITNTMLYIQRYVPLKNVFFFLIFALTGLPPFGLFLVKFNILIFVLYQTHIFVAAVLFLMFFLNMLYYVQLFNFRNFKNKSYTQFNSEFFTQVDFSSSSRVNRSSYDTFSLLFFIITVLFLFIFSFFFFNDLFLVVNTI